MRRPAIFFGIGRILNPVIRRGLAAIALLAVAACGSPTAPTPPVSTTGPSSTPPATTTTLPGVWAGYLWAMDCPAGYPCRPETLVPFVLRISAAGPAVAALEVVEGSARSVVMDVTGVAQPDGAVLFTGHRGELRNDQAQIELRRLLVRLDSATGLSGEIDLRRSYTTGGQNRSLEGRILSAAYQPFADLAARGVSGSWSGLAVVRACSGYCPVYQNEGDTMKLSLVVGQAGSSVTGQLLIANSMCNSCWLPVSGRVTGTSVSLTSERHSFSALSGNVFHLQSFEGTIDQLGRIQGRFVLQADGRIAVNPFDVSYRHEGEILWLMRD